MQNNLKYLISRLLPIAITLVLCATMSGYAGDTVANDTAEIYYTAVNIWSNDPRHPIPSTNYHLGEIIPVGTKVTIHSKNQSVISFSTEDSKKRSILHMRRHSRITVDELFDRLFTTVDALEPSGIFSKLTKQEKKAVAQGTVFEGMTKTAVLIAYGYPPSHKTPKLDANIWIYWTGRRRTVKILFNSENKVESIEGLIREAGKKGKGSRI